MWRGLIVSTNLKTHFSPTKASTEDTVSDKTHGYTLEFEACDTSIRCIVYNWYASIHSTNSETDDFCTFASKSVHPFSKISQGSKSTSSRRFEPDSSRGINVLNWTYKKTLFNADRTNWLWFFQFEYAASHRRQFRGYLRKSKFSRLSNRYNAQPPAGIFHIYPIDDSDDVGFSVDIIFTTQSLTTHISFNSVKASNSKPRVSDGNVFFEQNCSNCSNWKRKKTQILKNTQDAS